jgi:hypothetical protein
MEMKTVTLESLVVSQNEVATDAVAAALNGYVLIIKETGEVMPTAQFADLNATSKILIYLLGLRAATILGIGNKAAANAEEIAAVLGLETQRVRENLSRMKRNFLLKSADGWQLPVARIPAACAELKKKGQSQT